MNSLSMYLDQLDERMKGNDKVMINFGSAWPVLKIYDPTVGITATQIRHNSKTVLLELSNHPLIVEVPPSDK